MMKALIHKGRVIQVFTAAFPVALPLTWADVPAGTTVAIGDSYDKSSGRFAAAAPASPIPAGADIAMAQSIMRALVATEFQSRAASIVAGQWPELERETFAQQRSEAAAFVADASAATPLLDALTLPGETKADLAGGILAKSAALDAALGRLIQAKRAHLAAIHAHGVTVDQLRTYDVSAGWPA